MGVPGGGFPPWEPVLTPPVSLLQAQQQHLASLPLGGEKRMVALKDMADESRHNHAHTAGLLQTVSPGDWTSRVWKEALACLDSLVFLMEGDHRGLGTRRCVLWRSRQAVQEYAVHGGLSSACRRQIDAFFCLQSLCSPSTKHWVSYSPLTERVVPTKAFPMNTVSEGRRHSSRTQAWHPPTIPT